MSEFFEPPPPPPVPDVEDEYQPKPWHAPYDNQIGGGVGLEVVLVRTDDIAISLERFVAYPNGVSFKLVRRYRTEEIGWELDEEHGPGFFGRGPRAVELAARRLRFGVRFPDGSKATDMRPWWSHDEEPTPPVLVQSGGGGGGGRNYSEGWWLWPLPPDGSFEFAIEWPAAGIPLTFKEVQARPFREAAARSIELWPLQPQGGSFPSSVWRSMSTATTEDEAEEDS